MGVNSLLLPDCELNPGRTAPESSTPGAQKYIPDVNHDEEDRPGDEEHADNHSNGQHHFLFTRNIQVATVTAAAGRIAAATT